MIMRSLYMGLLLTALIVGTSCKSAKIVGTSAGKAVAGQVAVDESKAGRLPDGGAIGKMNDSMTEAQDKMLGKNDNSSGNDPFVPLAEAFRETVKGSAKVVETVLPGGVPPDESEKDK